MRDTLPTVGPKKFESAIVNLDESTGQGTHWVAYRKENYKTYYYDSFGDLPPPLELVKYFYSGLFKTKKIIYNYRREQDFNTVWCGHLCLKFLLNDNLKNE